jgi:hypothetical protein
MPLDERHLRERLDLRADRARPRGAQILDRRSVRPLGELRQPQQQAEFIDITGMPIPGFGTMAGMTS